MCRILKEEGGVGLNDALLLVCVWWCAWGGEDGTLPRGDGEGGQGKAGDLQRSNVIIDVETKMNKERIKKRVEMK